MRDYSALDADNERAAEVRTYGWGNVEGKGKRWNAQWAKLRALVAEFDRGEVDDPCPTARHWGGLAIDADRERAERAVREGRWRRADCGRTSNTFYAEVAQRRAVLAASEASGTKGQP